MVSKSQADKAGQIVRDFLFDEEGHPSLDSPEMEKALKTMLDYRASHFEPLATVYTDLRDLAASVDPGRPPTARPKRAHSIVAKLAKLPQLRLSQMEDIGGCRLVVPEIAQVRALLPRIEERWPAVSVDDYVQAPRDTGYRAVHAVVVEQDRRIEIQLRTKRQNEWADAVEDWGDRLGLNVPGANLKARVLPIWSNTSGRRLPSSR